MNISELYGPSVTGMSNMTKGEEDVFFRDDILLPFNESWNNINDLKNISTNTTKHIQSSGDSLEGSISILIILTVSYSFIFIAGVLGNLITCTVIARNKSMHTATNYYLFNLAISDLILLISGMPYELYNMWYINSYPFTDVVCILQGILSETSANATVLTVTAFTVERYIAICHPFRQHTMSKLSRAVKFIMAIWVIAFILATPQAMQFGVVRIGRGGTSCTMKNNFARHAFEVSGFIFFVGPMTAICVLYVLIGVKLKKSKLMQGVKRNGCDLNRAVSGQTRVIRMLVAVAVAFFLCWAPFHAQRLMAVYGSVNSTTNETYYGIYTILTYISGVSYFLSTCINPLLYNIMSYKFREAFKLTLARQFGLESKYQLTTQNYSAISRQNGSIRVTNAVQTRQNMYCIGQLRKRESDVSLEGSLRTKSNPRSKCISASQSTLLTSLSKNDMYSTNPVNRYDFQIADIEDATDLELHQHHHLMPSHSSLANETVATILSNNESSPSLVKFPNLNKINCDRNSLGSKLSTEHGVSCSKNCHTDCESDKTLSNVIKPTTLETISEKLRRGTRRVLQIGPSSTSQISSHVPPTNSAKSSNSEQSTASERTGIGPD